MWSFGVFAMLEQEYSVVTSCVSGRGNVFIVFVCLSVSVRAITFEPVDIETSFLVWWTS